MSALLHTVIVLLTIFLSYWYGLFRGFHRGLNEGLAEGSAIALKQTLEYMRSKHDIHITDYDINEASEYLKNERS
jgi:hypothetical protein